jgi:acyl-CoA dehydrogenase family protein 9
MDEEQKRMAEELLFSGEQKPSFAKQLYFGSLDTERVFPFPHGDPSEKKRIDKLVQDLDAFAKKHINASEIDKNSEIPDSVIEGLGKLGIMGMSIPKEHGGLGVSQYGYCKAMECLSRHCGSTALFVNAHQSVGMKALLIYGTDEQKKRWLPGLARGEYIAAFSLTEPTAGSDAAGIKTKAVYNAEKDTYTITGEKQWTTNGGIADLLTVMALTTEETPKGPVDKVTAFLITPDMPGFRILDAALEKVGMKGSKTANLAFDGVEVPAKNILGPLGGGLKVCLNVLNFGRITFGSTCTGAAKESLERALQHSIDRHQFKRPLCSFPLVKEKITQMSALAYAMDATTYLTAALLDRGEDDFMLESAMLKVFASDSLWKILYDSMQILGGRSFFTDQPFERMMRDARLNMIGEGSNEVMRAFIGLVGMRDVGMQLGTLAEAAKSPVRNSWKILRFAGQWLARLKLQQIPVSSPELQEEAKNLAKLTRRFGLAITRLLAHHKEDILERQLELNRIATAAMAIYTTTAVLSKIDSDLKTEKLKHELAIAKHYCNYANKKAKCALDKILNPDDINVEALSDTITAKA